jgi:hypothetical protein
MMSFSTGGLLLNESVELARLHREEETWIDTIARALENGTNSLPKASSQRRTLREIANRISTLTWEELDFFVGDASRTDQQALLWLATCRAYRFIREFALEVIRERYLSYQLDLPHQTFDVLFDAKAEWHDSLASLSTSTRLKLRQTMFRMLREAGVVSEGNRIQSAIISTRLKNLIKERNPNELAIFPGVLVEGASV